MQRSVHVFTNDLLGQKQRGTDWFVGAAFVCVYVEAYVDKVAVYVCMCQFVCTCICIYLLPAALPVKCPCSDTTDDGCAAVISSIYQGVPLVFFSTAQLSTHSEKGESPICAFV